MTIDEMKSGLSELVTEEPDGSVTMKLRLPDKAALNEMAKTMAMFGGAGK